MLLHLVQLGPGMTQQQPQYQQQAPGSTAPQGFDSAAYNAAVNSSNTGYGFDGQPAGAGYSAGFAAAGGSFGPPPPPSGFGSSSGYEQQQQQQQAGWPFADTTTSSYQQGAGAAGRTQPPAGLLPSDITLIGRRDADSMLPLGPSNDQARYYQPRTVSERLVQVIGSFGVSVVLSKSAVLAGPALLYPIWGPWIRAGLRNLQLYLRQFKSVGLWRAEVLTVQVNTIPYAYRQAGGDTITVTVGDPWLGGARSELTFAYQPGCEDIVEGEPAELLVLCQDERFVNFKVVREVYLPQSGIWLSEYPFVDRDVFLDVSLAIERGRQAAADGPAAAGGSAAARFGGFVDLGTDSSSGPASYTMPPSAAAGVTGFDGFAAGGQFGGEVQPAAAGSYGQGCISMWVCMI
ncbi:hypothetical protein COO60DRAFT_118700 [Scenedesmus sp. NREL 46B-D3]|nr:hypothetical protein COO60DRAFT_118700 [Scenedesmus sp. NREL 46B-D3]